MREETPFIILESWFVTLPHCRIRRMTDKASMITIAVFALLAFHPGFGFQNRFNDLEFESVPTSAASKEVVSLIAAEEPRS